MLFSATLLQSAMVGIIDNHASPELCREKFRFICCCLELMSVLLSSHLSIVMSNPWKVNRMFMSIPQDARKAGPSLRY